MASSLPLKYWCSLLALFSLATSCCTAEADAVDALARAMTCFSDQYVYSTCQQPYRLYPAGKISVPPQATDEYCSGPCLIETKLVLTCISNILYNFRFYNGATIQDVKYTLNTGCSHTSKRGDFNVPENVGQKPAQYGGYRDDQENKSTKLFVSMHLLSLSLILLLGYY